MSTNLLVAPTLAPPLPSRSIHHLMPTSRCIWDWNKHRRSENNTQRISTRRHVAWHRLFSNMTPLEALVRVIRDWSPPGYFTTASFRVRWESTTECVTLGTMPRFEMFCFSEPPTFDERAWKILFRNRPAWAVAVNILEHWTPDGYVRSAFLAVGGEWKYRYVADK